MQVQHFQMIKALFQGPSQNYNDLNKIADRKVLMAFLISLQEISFKIYEIGVQESCYQRTNEELTAV